MIALKKMSKENKFDLIIITSILILSMLVGIFVGLNEEWFDTRDFTAGYMSGSLLTVILLFSIYRSIAFFFEKKTNN